MRDLSLHVLNLIENSVHAGATRVTVMIEEDLEADMLRLTVEDNGRGMSESELSKVFDPFFTTKSTARKRTGLGLSFLREVAEAADGEIAVSRLGSGGLKVCANMRISHIDRPPMGDMAVTMASAICANPRMNIRFVYRAGGKERIVSSDEIEKQCADSGRGGLAVARKFGEAVRSCIVSSSVG